MVRPIRSRLLAGKQLSVAASSGTKAAPILHQFFHGTVPTMPTTQRLREIEAWIAVVVCGRRDAQLPRSPRAVSEAPPARNHESHWSAWALSIQRLEGSCWLWDLNGAE